MSSLEGNPQNSALHGFNRKTFFIPSANIQLTLHQKPNQSHPNSSHFWSVGWFWCLLYDILYRDGNRKICSLEQSRKEALGICSASLHPAAAALYAQSRFKSFWPCGSSKFLFQWYDMTLPAKSVLLVMFNGHRMCAVSWLCGATAFEWVLPLVCLEGGLVSFEDIWVCIGKKTYVVVKL